MSHLLLLPVIVPMLAGAMLLMLSSLGQRTVRTVSVAAAASLVPIAVSIFSSTFDGSIDVYYVGDWPAPFGIVLVADRLAALMLLLGSVLGVAACVYASFECDRYGPRLQAMLQFQLLGINGAFLTGDLFNLFVSFEILLIASYCLLMYGGGKARARAAVHVVALNLAGSAVFLVGIGAVYAATGTLNFADLATRAAAADPSVAPLLQAGAWLLLVVFALKAAAVPLGFWLPGAYGNAYASVACLFAIMTKVGIYAVIRVHGLVFGSGDAALPEMPWLLPIGLATVVLGAGGALGARHVGALVAHLVVVSAGTLFAALGLGSDAALAAALFYLANSTLVTAGLFLLGDVVARQRGTGFGNLSARADVAQPVWLGGLFLVGIIGIVGLPPFAGFAAKVWLLGSALASPHAAWFYAGILGAGAVTLVALARAFTGFFWSGGSKHGEPVAPRSVGPSATAATLLGCAVVLMAIGGPFSRYTLETATQLGTRVHYVDSVMENVGVGRPLEARPFEPYGKGKP